MNVLLPLATVAGIFLLGWLGARQGLEWELGVVVPYIAGSLFLGGMIWRVLGWANVPVPFRIPTTCGQQKSLDWIKQERTENPDSTAQVIGRMTLEVLFFRSLLRNTKSEVTPARSVSYRPDLWLWVAAIAFHWSLLFILIRHIRLFVAPVPGLVTLLQKVEGFHRFGEPVFYVTSFAFLAALSYLLVRRLLLPQVRYISLAADYFPLILLLAIGASGVWLRHVDRTGIADVKGLAIGLATLSPAVPATISPLFFGHLLLVCALLAYFPFSKLVHMPGVFLSPTRNLANNNRRVRYVNPWNYPVKVHTYAEYEDELRDKMIAAGLPVEKQPASVPEREPEVVLERG